MLTWARSWHHAVQGAASAQLASASPSYGTHRWDRRLWSAAGRAPLCLSPLWHLLNMITVTATTPRGSGDPQMVRPRQGNLGGTERLMLAQGSDGEEACLPAWQN